MDREYLIETLLTESAIETNTYTALVQGCVNRDPKAQKELYTLFSAKLYAICLRYTKNVDDANDTFQEAFILIFEKIHTYKGTGSLEGWLKKTTIHSVLYSLKKRDLLKMAFDTEEHHKMIPPTDEIHNNYNYQDLIHVINKLPEGKRIVFNLHAVEGFGHDEIAQMLQISEATSRSQLARAREILKELLRNEKKV